ncbi:MAG: hypothetical protein ACLFV8_14420 [Alphaproteobacteria bacterium]
MNRKKHFAKAYKGFDAPISERHDCGRYCAPLNGGKALCCSTDHTIPVVDKEEFRLLKERTDLWSKYKPTDAHSQKIVDDLHHHCTAIKCKGVEFCERHNRTIACRAFPFFPYFTREEEIVGVSYYWSFEDRCWVLSNLRIAEPEFVRQLIWAYEYLFKRDEEERQAYIDQSVSMRRVFSRANRAIPIIGRDGEPCKVMPKTGGKVVPAKWSDFKPMGPYRSNAAYAEAIREAGGDPKGHKLPKV